MATEGLLSTFIKVFKNHYIDAVSKEKNYFNVQSLEAHKNEKVFLFSPYILNNEENINALGKDKFVNLNDYGMIYSDVNVILYIIFIRTLNLMK